MTKAHLNNSFHTTKEQDLKDRLSLPPELDDFKQVLIQAANSGKYEPNNWLLADGGKQDKTSQYNSISHHINQILLGNKVDKDSKLDHRLHAACRLLMDYTRDKRGLTHPIDETIDQLKSRIERAKDYDKSGNEQSGVSYLADDYGIWGNKFYGRD